MGIASLSVLSIFHCPGSQSAWWTRISTELFISCSGYPQGTGTVPQSCLSPPLMVSRDMFSRDKTCLGSKRFGLWTQTSCTRQTPNYIFHVWRTIPTMLLNHTTDFQTFLMSELERPLSCLKKMIWCSKKYTKRTETFIKTRRRSYVMSFIKNKGVNSCLCQ